jgi:hypothetical protein
MSQYAALGSDVSSRTPVLVPIGPPTIYTTGTAVLRMPFGDFLLRPEG